MRFAVILIAQIFLLWMIYAISDFIVSLLHLPIPASVLGMIILFLLLLTGVVKTHYIEKATFLLNRHLAFFFIPFSVGLMKYGGLIKANGFQLLAMLIGSSVIGLLVTGGVSQLLSRKKEMKSSIKVELEEGEHHNSL